MSLYVFECPKCHERLQVNVSMEEMGTFDQLCPNCDTTMAQDFSVKGCNFVLNGLGWARDGYSKDIDDCEKFWAEKDPSKVGRHVGTETKEEVKKLKEIGKWRKRERKFKGTNFGKEK